jgi:hypothetical protein
MNSILEIEQKIIEYSEKKDRIVRGLWGVDCLYNPTNNGRVFDYKFLVSQTAGQGCAYSIKYDYPHDFLRKYVGQDFLEKDINDVALKVCVFDSIYGTIFPPKHKKRMVLNSCSFEKMKWRTKIIFDEAIRLLGSVRNKKIVNVGVVGDILLTFKEKGAIISGTDFDNSIVGASVFGDIQIASGDETIKKISDADLAIVTGMTITTNTIDDIIKCCCNRNVKIIIFAETGANLASYYLNQGVNVYLSEYFPFYIFNSTSIIDVCYR